MIGARKRGAPLLILLALMLLGLGLRLLVWRWREFYDLSGDEREYFQQALTLLQGRGYVELPLMRPPLYTIFLAVVFQLFDSQVQRVRLLQAVISTATIPLIWLWTRELFVHVPRRERIAVIAAALTAVSYTFAAAATELLTETVFIAGLTLAFWLLGGAARRSSRRRAALAGLVIGALCLVRSVALPLVPLGAAWLLAGRATTAGGRFSPFIIQLRSIARGQWPMALWLALGALLVIAPWTIRNVATYQGLIVIDTTGAENLWLDNDPAGREAVKRELYKLGDDRATRQALAMQRGRTAILSDPARFLNKAWVEAQKFVALEYFDDLRTRRAIWVPPLDVWLRLLLGDGMWLLAMLGGSAGLWFARNLQFAPRSAFSDPRWLLVPWVLYVFATALIFHVEIRYRLPVYPALIPFAAWSLNGLWPVIRRPSSLVRFGGTLATVAAVLTLLALHRSYLTESMMLARKHYHLWQSDQARADGDLFTARQQAEAVLRLDAESALARVKLGLSTADPVEAQQWWRAAINVLPAHPYAHLLLGNALLRAADLDGARREFAYETASLEDLQQWSVAMFQRPSQPRLDIGDGLDLGVVSGFYPPQDGARWSRGSATVLLAIENRTESQNQATLSLRLRSPRPSAAPPALVRVIVNGVELPQTVQASNEWQTVALALPETSIGRDGTARITLQTPTFRPRAYDPTNGDNRALGVQLDWAMLQATSTP